MRAILQIVSLLALVALTLPSVAYLAGRMELGAVKWIMLAATVVWFVAAAPWMWKDNGAGQQDAD
ncbi:MAG: hypothetical protein ABIF19_14335 [Planctomycetota bacterium]